MTTSLRVGFEVQTPPPRELRQLPSRAGLEAYIQVSIPPLPEDRRREGKRTYDAFRQVALSVVASGIDHN